MPTSFNNSPVLAFEPSWSMQRLLLTMVQYLICVGVPWLIPDISVTARILLNAVGIGTVSFGLLHVGWWGSRRITKVTWQQSGDWVLQGSGLPPTSVWALLPSSFVGAFLIVLRWRCDDGLASVVMIYGELPASEWRRWLARLRLQGSPGVSPRGDLQ